LSTLPSSPTAAPSTCPSTVFFTQPVRPSASACWAVHRRKLTPWTSPRTCDQRQPNPARAPEREDGSVCATTRTWNSICLIIVRSRGLDFIQARMRFRARELKDQRYDVTTYAVQVTREPHRNRVLARPSCPFPHPDVPFGVTYDKIGTIQRRLAWPLHKDDTLSRSGRPAGLNIYPFYRG
jgi:hypothetical protein